jgi:hypothetical protein
MTIACLGWGSLIWDPRTLPVDGDWKDDGPDLPIEFARRSGGNRITLVLVPGAASVRTLWAPLKVQSLSDAVTALNEREGRPGSHRIGRWPGDKRDEKACQEVVTTWAKKKDLTGVVWTALPPKFGSDERVPSIAEVLAHLSGLEGEERGGAEQYIRCAPKQIRTPYRSAIEAELGWTPI